MGILDDFFGDGREAKKECLHCGGTEGKLEVAVSDNYGPTHWAHPECAAQAEEDRRRKAEEDRAAVARLESFNETDGAPE